MRAANDGLRFVLELGVLVAVGWWGAGAAAFAAVGRVRLALVCGGAAAIHLIATFVLGRR